MGHSPVLRSRANRLLERGCHHFLRHAGCDMEIRVLGCYGSELPGFNSTAFLLNGRILLDAGTVTSALNIEEQLEITHALISHSHFDHIKDILFLAGNVIPQHKHPICIISLRSIIDLIKANLLNNAIWPDFSSIPLAGGSPILNYLRVDEETEIIIGEITCQAVKVNHTVEAVGYIIRDPGGTLVYSGDTGRTDRIWEVAHKEDNLRVVITEVSFPNDLHDLAILTGHLTPMMLSEELLKLNRPNIPVYVCHMKPAYIEQIQKELRALAYSVKPLAQGDIISF